MSNNRTTSEDIKDSLKEISESLSKLVDILPLEQYALIQNEANKIARLTGKIKFQADHMEACLIVGGIN